MAARAPKGAALKVVVVAATGGLGSRVTLAALRAGHEVTAFARSQAKVDEAFPAGVRVATLRVVLGDATDPAAVKAVVEDADVVVECLGNDQRGEAIDTLIAAVATCAAVRSGVCAPPALLVLGGSPALVLPNGEPATSAPRLSGMVGLAAMHLATLGKLRAAAPALGAWAQVCPSRMSPSATGEPSVGLFRLRPNVVDLAVYAPGAPALTYEDVAGAFVALLDVAGSGYNRQQVAFALATTVD